MRDTWLYMYSLCNTYFLPASYLEMLSINYSILKMHIALLSIVKVCTFCIKGIWYEIFDFRFFHKSVAPRGRWAPSRAISNFYENSLRYSQLCLYRLCQRRCSLVSETPAINYPRCRCYRLWIIARVHVTSDEALSLIFINSMTLVISLLPVTMTPEIFNCR